MKNSIAQLGGPVIELQAVAAQAGKPDAHPKTLAFSLQPLAFHEIPRL
jgi:hypothetical protein